MTNWLASTSLWNTSCPESGHLIHKFSGVSRRRMLRIFGRTTLVSQFMFRSEMRLNASTGIWRPGLSPTSRDSRLIPRNYGLFCGLFRAPDALRQGSDQIGNGADGL